MEIFMQKRISGSGYEDLLTAVHCLFQSDILHKNNEEDAHTGTEMTLQS